MDYSKWSDERISDKVGELAGIALFDLSDPADAWPIVVENNMAVNTANGWVSALSKDGVYVESRSKNPLRAAMIVYLMMKDSNPSTLQSEKQGDQDA